MTEAERITRAKKKEYLKRYYLAHREAIRERQAINTIRTIRKPLKERVKSITGVSVRGEYGHNI